MFALCDCNNFFASCERLFRPSLNWKPVIVLSSNDGCVIARSNEAKALGIKMGQPFFQIKELVENKKVTVFSANLTLYGDLSWRVMSILRDAAPQTEVYSIDEAFMDVSGIENLADFGLNLVKTIKRQVGIPVSIGIAPTKTLAKIASKLCKTYPKLGGCCVMTRPEDIEKVLKRFPIGDVWGIGRKYTKLLEEHGIRTAWDFRQLPPEFVRSKMTVIGLRTQQELKGISCITLESALPDKQSICVSRSFAKELTEYAELHSSLMTFTAMAAEKLRKQKSVASQVSVFIYTNRFRDDQKQHSENKIVKFEASTDSTLTLAHYVSQALKSMYREGYGYKKAGVILSDMASASGIQQTLFEDGKRAKRSQLMSVVDNLNRQQGKYTVILASQGFDPIKMNREHLSPSYTTSWTDILKVKV